MKLFIDESCIKKIIEKFDGFIYSQPTVIAHRAHSNNEISIELLCGSRRANCVYSVNNSLISFHWTVLSVEGPTFTISRVNRLHMGAYLCIASNGVPPSVSKRITLIVHCKWNAITYFEILDMCLKRIRQIFILHFYLQFRQWYTFK